MACRASGAGVSAPVNQFWMVSRGIYGRSLASRNPVRFLICIGVRPGELACRVQFASEVGQVDVLISHVYFRSKGPRGELDQCNHYHKNARASHKRTDVLLTDSNRTRLKWQTLQPTRPRATDFGPVRRSRL